MNMNQSQIINLLKQMEAELNKRAHRIAELEKLEKALDEIIALKNKHSSDFVCVNQMTEIAKTALDSKGRI